MSTTMDATTDIAGKLARTTTGITTIDTHHGDTATQVNPMAMATRPAALTLIASTLTARANATMNLMNSYRVPVQAEHTNEYCT
jgi:hypothetical protein